MARQILSFGVPGTHPRISKLQNFEDAICLSDYEALVFDPFAISSVSVTNEVFARRQAEVKDLVQRKGGLLVCYLRPATGVQVVGRGLVDVLSLFDPVDVRIVGMVRRTLRKGTSINWEPVKGVSGIAGDYLEALSGHLRAEAFLEAEDRDVRSYSGTVIAVNSVGWPVSVEFLSGTGRLCFVPVAVDVPDGQLGAAIAHMVEDHFGGGVDIDAPAWSEIITVPGADAHDSRIEELEKEAKRVAEELSQLSEERSALLNFKVLLYGYGKSVLEPVVRRAFRALGFTVLEPEQYKGDWDLDVADPGGAVTAVGEVEGSEGAISIGKLRQLLNYVEAEEDAGRNRKGILVGNGYRLKDLDEPERHNQFTEKVLKEACGFEYCLLPTTELFAAVCAVLKAKNDETLMKHIRASLLARVGVWSFVEDCKLSGSAGSGS
ncbi:MAG TPA: hypothetical protein VNE63_11695 [Candidatus Acidoferrales bacterium]|nr:hypothetical protein [Candidatus Acidoferrales bacterium]